MVVYMMCTCTAMAANNSRCGAATVANAHARVAKPRELNVCMAAPRLLVVNINATQREARASNNSASRYFTRANAHATIATSFAAKFADNSLVLCASFSNRRR